MFELFNQENELCLCFFTVVSNREPETLHLMFDLYIYMNVFIWILCIENHQTRIYTDASKILTIHGKEVQKWNDLFYR